VRARQSYPPQPRCGHRDCGRARAGRANAHAPMVTITDWIRANSTLLERLGAELGLKTAWRVLGGDFVAAPNVTSEARPVGGGRGSWWRARCRLHAAFSPDPGNATETLFHEAWWKPKG
jgi:hypothetical protein